MGSPPPSPWGSFFSLTSSPGQEPWVESGFAPPPIFISYWDRGDLRPFPFFPLSTHAMGLLFRRPKALPFPFSLFECPAPASPSHLSHSRVKKSPLPLSPVFGFLRVDNPHFFLRHGPPSSFPLFSPKGKAARTPPLFFPRLY